MIIGVIPARFASTRFPKKMLALLQGKPIIQWVFEKASQAKLLDKVVVATDHPEIEKAVQGFSGNVVMTSENHQSGTDRCAEVAEKMGLSNGWLVNIQGDEPLIEPSQIDQLCRLISSNSSIDIGTLVKKANGIAQLESPNLVKVVKAHDGRCLYFSRSAIPFNRDIAFHDWCLHHDYWLHVGMYSYRIDVLNQLKEIKPSPLELVEKLEQLRWLENGYEIYSAVTEYDNHGVDTVEDLVRIEKMLNDFKKNTL